MWNLLEIKNAIAEHGFSGPLNLFTPKQCREFLQSISGDNAPAPLDWEKGCACTSRSYYEVARHPAILRIISSLLSNDVILWGCSLICRPPGAVHAWHSDIESIGGKTVSVWIGIENTTVDSSLQMIARSHRFGRAIQEVRYDHGKTREDTKTEHVVQWAQEWDQQSRFVRPAMNDGDLLFFHGDLWHGSHNLTTHTRKALLLQYATANTPIRIPDANYLDWPIRKLDMPRPPCLLLLGSSSENTNRIVSPPVSSNTGTEAQLTSCAYPLSLPLPPDERTGWKPYPIFSGCTSNIQTLSCHVSVLNYNCSPHPPHKHAEEEILVLLAGEVDLLLPKMEERHLRLKPHEFVYYPAGFPHSLQAVSRDPAIYLMLKWHNELKATERPMGFGHFRMVDVAAKETEPGLQVKVFSHRPTVHLGRLQFHASHLAAGSGYAPHADAHDVAIVVLEGEVETLGQRVRPCGVIFSPAGQLHGMQNPGEQPAKYLVFEFQGRSRHDSHHVVKSGPTFIAKLTDPYRWIGKAKSILKGFGAIR